MTDAPATDPSAYVPPKVWTWNKESGGRFASINRPVSGATHEAELPVGRHPFQLYSLGTPNGQKVTIMLEELLAAGYKGAFCMDFLVDTDTREVYLKTVHEAGLQDVVVLEESAPYAKGQIEVSSFTLQDLGELSEVASGIMLRDELCH